MCGRMTQNVNLNTLFEKYQLSPETPRPNLEARYAAPAIAHLHHRQPVILDDAGVNVWLDADAAREQLFASALKPAAGAYENWPVTRAVNDPDNDWRGLTECLAA